MNENEQEISSKMNNNQQINNEKRAELKTISIIDIFITIQKIPLFICLKGCFNLFRKKWNNYQSKCSIFVQLILYLIPLSIILYIFIFFIHFFGFERIFKFDYYFAIQQEYVNYLISDLDDTHFELGSQKYKSQLGDMDHLFFFDIYFTELISMGLLEETSPDKIYPNISSNSDYLYQAYDEFSKDNNLNTIFTIPKEEAEKYIDKREDVFSEIGKLYYYFLPMMAYEFSLEKSNLNESILIAYEFDNETKEITDNNYLYFSYPLKINENLKKNFFYPGNSLLSPIISSKKPIHGERFNNSFYKENWLIQLDYQFRAILSNRITLLMNFLNLKYNYYGNLNKSDIVIMQSRFQPNNTRKSYIINIIFYFNLGETKEEYLDYSYFLLWNESIFPIGIEKYSDNETFLISQHNISELLLSSAIHNYFHYGLIDKNYNFFKYGISYDSLNLENMAEPLKFYKSTESLNSDLRYFSSLYLYASLLQKLNHFLENEDSKQLTEFHFINRKETIESICKEIDFNSYINFLKNMNVDCLDENNLLYYSGTKAKEDVFNFNYNIMPSCICLPLYCLTNLKENMNLKDIKQNQFIHEMKLPSKCKNNFHNLNGVNNDVNDSSIEDKAVSKLNSNLNKINFFSKKINENIEDEFFIFKYFKFPHLPLINFFVLAFVDNSDVKATLLEFLTELDTIKIYFLIIESIGMFVAFLVGQILLIIKVYKISKVIYDYKKILDNYLNKLESESNIDNNKEKKYSQISNLTPENKVEKGSLELTKNTFGFNLIYKNINDNPLLNDLSVIFRRYYKITKTQFIKKEHELRHSEKDSFLQEENELFLLLKILSVYIPKFKINITMDYNFYLNTKINLNFLKSIKKEKYADEKMMLITQCALYELLSTDNVHYDGLITNFHFNYITNIKCNEKKENNSIKNSMFWFIDKVKKDKEQKSENNEMLIEGENNNNDNIKIIWKEKSSMLEEFENYFENDDFLKKDNIKSVIESFLINAYYKYLKKIALLSPSSFCDEKEEI